MKKILGLMIAVLISAFAEATTLRSLGPNNPSNLEVPSNCITFASTNAMDVNYLSTNGLWVNGNSSVTGIVAANSFSVGATPTAGISRTVTWLGPQLTPTVTIYNGGLNTSP